MFDKYLEKILPIPIVDIEVSKKNGYKYRITTYSNVLDEIGTIKRIEIRLKNNKKIKSFDGWYFKEKDPYLKQMYIEFAR